MTPSRCYLLLAFALATIAPPAWAEKEAIICRLGPSGPPRRMAIHKDGVMMEKEKVTFLGIETAPVSRVLSTQLGLARGIGLVITSIVEESPAYQVLKEDDILTRFDDQILVNQHQLGVLVRSKKESDEVKLTIIRDGKETTVKAKLATHELPKMASVFPGESGGFGWSMVAPPAIARLKGMPGMDGEHARDVLRMIGRDHRNLLTTPGVRIFGFKGEGSTILDLPNSNISYSDDNGSIEIKSEDGKRTLTVKDAGGEVTFKGPINTREERTKLPPEVMKQLEKLDNDAISFEAGEQFEHEVLPLPAGPARTKIKHKPGNARDLNLRSL